jgi:hypothetical protein
MARRPGSGNASAGAVARDATSAGVRARPRRWRGSRRRSVRPRRRRARREVGTRVARVGAREDASMRSTACAALPKATAGRRGSPPGHVSGAKMMQPARMLGDRDPEPRRAWHGCRSWVGHEGDGASRRGRDADGPMRRQADPLVEPRLVLRIVRYADDVERRGAGCPPPDLGRRSTISRMRFGSEPAETHEGIRARSRARRGRRLARGWRTGIDAEPVRHHRACNRSSRASGSGACGRRVAESRSRRSTPGARSGRGCTSGDPARDAPARTAGSGCTGSRRSRSASLSA